MTDPLQSEATPNPASNASGARRSPVWLWFAIANAAALLAMAGVLAALWIKVGAQADSAAALAPGAASAGATATGDEGKAAGILDRAEQAVVLIQAYNSDGQKIGIGAGFLIGKRGRVATNAHVLAKAAKADVTFRNGTTIGIAGYRARDARADLAIVELNGSPGDVASLKVSRDPPPPKGSPVRAIGHPSGFQFSASEGIVSAVYATSDLPSDYGGMLKAPADQVWIKTTSAISPGSSGGPLLNAQGEVIGINTWVAGEDKLGFAIHARHLAELARRAEEETVPLSVVAEPQEALERLATLWQQELGWFNRRLNSAGDEKELKKIMGSNPGVRYARQFFEFADEHRREPAALQAMALLAHATAVDPSDEAGRWLQSACDRLFEDHAHDDGLDGVLLYIGGGPHPAGADFLRRVDEKTTNPRIKPLAAYLLAQWLLQQSADDDDDRLEAIALLERVQKSPGQETADQQSLAALAEEQLYLARNLLVGAKAPEIVGRDVDGVELKLSDFRGQVVMLDFWGNWCPHCINMYPHERELTQRFAGKPFVLLGVNDDNERSVAQKLQAEKEVTWRSWWDGGDKAIGEQWRVPAVPFVCLIDHEGVIRVRRTGAFGEELDARIGELVQQAQAAQKPAAQKPAAKPPENGAAEGVPSP